MTLGITVNPEIRKMVEELAKKYYTSISSIISRAISEFYKKNKDND